MSGFIQRILKMLAYGSAAIVVLLAILLALFRLLLPRLPEYQDELKAWASEAIGADVEFAGMDARWGLRGPELSFYDAELVRPATGNRVIAASEVGIIMSLPELLFEQSLVVDTVRVRDSSVELREQPDGSWELQGTRLPDLMSGRTRIGSFTLIGEDIDVLVLRTGDQRPTRLELRRIDASRDAKRTVIDASVRLPDELGTAMTVSATQLASADGDTQPLNVSVSAGELQLAGLSALYRHPERQVTAGHGELDLSFALVDTRLQNVSASASFEDVSLNGGAAFDLSAQIAYNAAADGWLLAVDELELATANGAWPLSSFRIEAVTNAAGGVRVLDFRAAHVDFADAGIVAGWLPEKERSLLDKWQPDGIVHNLVSTLKGLDKGTPDYAVSAELDRAGIAASGDVPGVRGFSGSLRADRAGGLLTVDAEKLTLDLMAWVAEPVELDRADGTVVWRRSGTQTTILSDNIVLSNALFDTRSNIEISLDGESSPVVDLASTWRIADIAVAKRFIPRRAMSDKLHQWFQDALLSGRIPSGSARLKGPLDRFPFDDGDGELRVEARIEALDFLYHPRFPIVNVSSMAVVLENMHLYTRDNRAVTTGNTTVDAAVDIRDLRRPVLTVNAAASGTLASLHAFASTSPVAQVFGGHLDKVSVDGPSTMALELNVPLRSWRDFDFTATVSSIDGSMRIAGFDPPLTELAGTVTVQRDHIESEGLEGRLLGGPVQVELADAGPRAPGYKVLAVARGTASAGALIDELSLPLEGLLTGQTEYSAELRFPEARYEPGQPFTVRLESALAGLAIALPAPFAKRAEDLLPLSGALVFDRGGAGIGSDGKLGNEVAWQLGFVRQEGHWDFDRGMLTLGTLAPSVPDVRGLHVRGSVPKLDVAAWLDVAGGEELKAGTANPLRSVDVQVGELLVVGQRLKDHRLKVDSSARDWLVQIEGDEVLGSVFVPYDFSPAATLVLNMERLVLAGEEGEDAAAEPPPSPLDPQSLPAISFRAAEFGVGERRFGAVEMELVHGAGGLVAERLVAVDPSFRIDGGGDWLVDASNSLGSRSRITATLSSTDVKATLSRLGYQPGIESEQMRMAFDLRWDGGPHADFLKSLDGQVEVQLGTGQLVEVEPGAGRVFGLMSIVALPRRLSLDFRDVFQKGFVFDEISGTFRLENGSAYTCDLSLVGPAADIGIAGQADLVADSYSQAAVVSANLGNTLPVVGAIAAGPQVAAALFLFSQVFKKPLKEVGQVYYSMSGSWHDPEVESTDAEGFAASAARAGCL
jgi:uncharacterized protein (TIGR02099 family)